MFSLNVNHNDNGKNHGLNSMSKTKSKFLEV